MAFQVYLRIKNDGKVNSKIQIDGNEIIFKSPENRFTFQSIFDQNATQSDIFKTVVLPLLMNAVVGTECCVLAHGVSGSGKTYTIQGTDDDCSEIGKSGIIRRAIYYAFEILREEFLKHIKVYVTFLEIYSEKIYNLLSESNDSISIRDDGKGETHLGLEEIPVSDVVSLLRYAEMGMENRRKKATAINFDSSRSHSVFSLRFVGTSGGAETSGVIRIIDLAGTETLSLKDSKQIATSLSSLVDVVKAVVKKKRHIPFRNSILTRLLKKSFSGRAKNALICTLSMDEKDVSRTLNTVKFGTLVGSIESTYKTTSLLTAEERAEIELQEETKEYARLMEECIDSVKVKELMEERGCNLAEIAETLSNRSEKRNFRHEFDMIKRENVADEKEIHELESRLLETDEITTKLKEEAQEAIEYLERKFPFNCSFGNLENVNSVIAAFQKLVSFDPHIKINELRKKIEIFVLFKNLEAKMSGKEESEVVLENMPQCLDPVPRVQEMLEHLYLVCDALTRRQQKNQ